MKKTYFELINYNNNRSEHLEESRWYVLLFPLGSDELNSSICSELWRGKTGDFVKNVGNMTITRVLGKI